MARPSPELKYRANCPLEPPLLLFGRKYERNLLKTGCHLSRNHIPLCLPPHHYAKLEDQKHSLLARLVSQNAVSEPASEPGLAKELAKNSLTSTTTSTTQAMSARPTPLHMTTITGPQTGRTTVTTAYQDSRKCQN